MAYTAGKTVLSNTSYNTLNSIAKSLGGEFLAAVPLVKTADDAKEYGVVVLGNGDFYNQFTGMLNKIAATRCYQHAVENNLELFNKGSIGPGAIVENYVVDYVLPDGYQASTANPGDCFKQNDPKIHYSLHPVNSKLVYTTTIKRAEVELCFNTVDGADNIIARIEERLTSSVNWDTFIMTKYTIARALLATDSLKRDIDTLTKETADDAVAAMKGVSNGMRFVSADYNEAEYPTLAPIDRQVCIMTSDANAKIDVYALAAAFNLEYKQLLGRLVMVNSFDFNEIEQARLDHIMEETADQGLVVEYVPFTEEEKAKLAAIKAAIVDESFFMIFDKLKEMESIRDPLHLSENLFYHVWKVYSHNPFAAAAYFTDYEAAPTPTETETETETESPTT